jgi:SAM-dependent methyltransferase
VYRIRVGVRGPKYELTLPHDTSGVCHSACQDLVHLASLSGSAPDRRHGGPYRTRAVVPAASCYVHPMSLDRVYAGDWIAAGYATSRPPVHSHILDRVASLQLFGQIDLALDVGCGAGISTIALMQRRIGNHVLGVDPSPAMIRRAKCHVEGASFLLSTAEALPMRSGTVGLTTAAGSLNYADIPAFFSETSRVLSPDGLLVVYDFGSGRCSAQCAELDSWYSEMLHRWPKPSAVVREVSRATFESAPMHLVAHENLAVSITFELDGYLDYLMTESNVGAAVSSGAAPTEIRSWCEEGLRQFFQESLPVEFESYYACLVQPR